MDIKKETKHIRGLASVLKTLAREVNNRGSFKSTDFEILKRVGSDLLFKGVTIDYRE